MERNTECFLFLLLVGWVLRRETVLLSCPPFLPSFLPLLLPSIPLSFFSCLLSYASSITGPPLFFLKLLDLGGDPPLLLLLGSERSNWQPLGSLCPELSSSSPGTGPHPFSSLCGCLCILALWHMILSGAWLVRVRAELQAGDGCLQWLTPVLQLISRIIPPGKKDLNFLMLPAVFHGLSVACVLFDLLYLSAFTADRVKALSTQM